MEALQYASSASAVSTCLVRNVGKIREDAKNGDSIARLRPNDGSVVSSSNTCLREVDHLMNLQSSGSADFTPGCGADIDSFCGRVRPGEGRIHACLVHQLPYLSDPCAAGLRRRYSGFSEQTFLSTCCNRDASRLCGAEQDEKKTACLIQKVLGTETVSEASVGTGNQTLLRKASSADAASETAKTPRFSWTCRACLKRHVKRLNRDSRAGPVLRAACSTEINLCKGERDAALRKNGPHDDLVECVVSKRKELQNSPGCLKALKKKLLQSVDDSSTQPFFNAGCGEDYLKFCPTVVLGRGSAGQCLFSHFQELSATCKQVGFGHDLKSGLHLSGGTLMDPSLRAACKQSLEAKGCAGLPSGQTFGCLWKHKQEEWVTVRCREYVEAVAERSRRERARSQGVGVVCKQDIKSLLDGGQCEGVRASMAEKIPTTSGFYDKNGERTEVLGEANQQSEMIASTNCLIEHLDKLSQPMCQALVLKAAQAQVFHPFRYRTGLAENCAGVLKEKCEDVSKTLHAEETTAELERKKKWEQIDCLVEAAEASHDEACSGHVQALIKLSRDPVMHPQIGRACASEKRKFCPNLAPGGAQVLLCLKSVATSVAFSTLCGDAVRRIVLPKVALNMYKSQHPEISAMISNSQASESADSEESSSNELQSESSFSQLASAFGGERHEPGNNSLLTMGGFMAAVALGGMALITGTGCFFVVRVLRRKGRKAMGMGEALE